MIDLESKDFWEIASIIPAAIFVVQDNKFVYHNKYFNYLTGLLDKEIIGKNFWELVHDDYKELIKERGQKRAAGENVISRYEFKINYKDIYKWVDYTAKPIVYNKKQGFIGIAFDITEKKDFEYKLKSEKEKAEKSDELKTAFLSNISHEIRTPMNSILGFSNILLKDTVDDDKKIKYAKNIQDSTKQLLEIINDIIEISKIQSNNVEIYIEEINLTEVFKNLYETFKIELKRRNKKNIDCKLSIPIKENYYIKTDEIKLKQVLNVLINNAIKFTKKGKIEFGFKDQGEYLLFFVKDTGIGINAKLLPNIFDRFFHVDLSNTKNYRGSGLGLAICKYYVKVLGGEIKVNSKLDVGSKFQFKLPKKSISYSNLKDDDIKSVNILKNKSVLIIENDELQKILFKENFEKTGLNIVSTKNQNAIDIFNKSQNIDLIILDSDNPEFDGIDILSKIKLLNPKIPIIFISSLKYYRENSIKAGADNFILKPIDFNVLLKTIKELLFK